MSPLLGTIGVEKSERVDASRDSGSEVLIKYEYETYIVEILGIERGAYDVEASCCEFLTSFEISSPLP